MLIISLIVNLLFIVLSFVFAAKFKIIKNQVEYFNEKIDYYKNGKLNKAYVEALYLIDDQRTTIAEYKEQVEYLSQFAEYKERSKSIGIQQFHCKNYDASRNVQNIIKQIAIDRFGRWPVNTLDMKVELTETDNKKVELRGDLQLVVDSFSLYLDNKANSENGVINKSYQVEIFEIYKDKQLKPIESILEVKPKTVYKIIADDQEDFEHKVKAMVEVALLEKGK